MDFLSAERYITPKFLIVEVKITYTDRNEWNVLNVLSAVKDGIRALNIPWSVKKDEVIPSMENGGGFEGILIISFKIKDSSKLKRIVYLLDNMKANLGIQFSVLKIEPIAPSTQIKDFTNRLKRAVLEKAVKRALQYQKILNKKCSMYSIHFKNPKLLTLEEEKGKRILLKIEAKVEYLCQ